MPSEINLSIIIVNFNTYKFLKECINSIYKNAPIFASEIIVVDNASSDGSADKIHKNFPRVRLIANKKNIGFAAANNQGIKQASGKYILLLNPDTVISKNVLDRTAGLMDQNPQAGIVTCKVVLAGGSLDDACHRGFPTPWNAFCYFSGLAGLFPKSKLLNGYHLGFCDMDKTHEIDACAGAFMLIRREAGEMVRWLDEDYFWYGEDLDFCYRIKQAGWKVMFTLEAEIIHYKGVSSGIKRHSQSISSADKSTQLFATKSRFEVMRIFYDKHYKGKYPVWLTALIFSAIKFKEYLNLVRYK